MSSSSVNQPSTELKTSKVANSRKQRQPQQQKPDQEKQSSDNADLLRVTKMTVDALVDKIAAIESVLLLKSEILTRTQLEAKIIAYEHDRAILLAAIEAERSARYAAIDAYAERAQSAASPPSAASSKFVHIVRHAPGRIILDVELVPQARVRWCCSMEDTDPRVLDFESAGCLWHEAIARCFDTSCASISAHPCAPRAALPFADLHFSRHCQDSTLVSSHYWEFEDGCPQTGYKIIVPNTRLIQILTGAAVAIREAHSE